MENKGAVEKRIGAAWITFRRGQHAAAIKEFEHILSDHPEHPDALFGMGLVLRTSGDADGARKNWEKALKLAMARLEAIGDERTAERERVFMTSTMLKQRLAELDQK